MARQLPCFAVTVALLFCVFLVAAGKPYYLAGLFSIAHWRFRGQNSDKEDLSKRGGCMKIAIAGATGQVGVPFAAATRAAGHEVVGLARSAGVDLTQRSDDLVTLLEGTDVVVDVTRTTSREEDSSSEFFSAVATNLGEAASEAGVKRTVLLSIIGVDRIAESPRDPATAGVEAHYRAKFVHEQATVAHAPGAHIVRAAQFHDLARVQLEAFRRGDTSYVPDMPVQPVDVPLVVQVLLDVATGALERPVVEVAGPRQERLAELAARFAARDSDAPRVEPVPVAGVVAGGALLPGPDAVIGGPTFDEWFGAPR